jgi:hypothetical protein
MLIDTGRTINNNNKEGMDKKGPLPIPKKDTSKKAGEQQNPNVRSIIVKSFHREPFVVCTSLMIT